VEEKRMNKEKEAEARGVDSVTDFHEEKEADAAKAQENLASLNKSAAENESVAVVLQPDDVAALEQECELSKEAAESLLRRNGGSLPAALAAFIHGEN